MGWQRMADSAPRLRVGSNVRRVGLRPGQIGKQKSAIGVGDLWREWSLHSFVKPPAYDVPGCWLQVAGVVDET